MVKSQLTTFFSVDSPEEPQHAQLPPQVPGRPPVGMPVGPGGVPPGPYMNMPDAATSHAQAQAYQHFIQQQQAAAQAQAQRGGYLPQHPAQMQQPHPTQTS
jgi:pheromone receptor transcription factor